MAPWATSTRARAGCGCRAGLCWRPSCGCGPRCRHRSTPSSSAQCRTLCGRVREELLVDLIPTPSSAEVPKRILAKANDFGRTPSPSAIGNHIDPTPTGTKQPARTGVRRHGRASACGHGESGEPATCCAELAHQMCRAVSDQRQVHSQGLACSCARHPEAAICWGRTSNMFNTVYN